MKYNNRVCVIVDPFSTGKFIAPALSSRGYRCIYIQSSRNLPDNLTLSVKKDDFILHLIYDNNVELILEQLNSYRIKLCLPGSESGVELADILAEKLNLLSNTTMLSQARRDKFLMTETVNKTGLNTAQHFKSSKFDEIVIWIKKLNSYPVVLKPIKSASGDNVFICQNLDEVQNAFKKISQSNDLFGEANTEVLVESYITGDEYIINTVSYNGKHLVAEIWQVERIPQTTIYDRCTVITPDNERYEKLQSYTFKVLDALQIKYGAATTELKYSINNGSTLIECGSRLMGGAELSFASDYFGYTQLSLMLEAYFEPKIFLQRLSMKLNSEPKYGMAVLLISNVEGYLQTDLDLANQLSGIKTLHCFELDVYKKDQRLHKTVDLLTCPGTIYLLGCNKEAILEDYRAIRELESHLYQKAVVNPASQPQQPTISFWSKEESNTKLLQQKSTGLTEEGCHDKLTLNFNFSTL